MMTRAIVGFPVLDWPKTQEGKFVLEAGGFHHEATMTYENVHFGFLVVFLQERNPRVVLELSRGDLGLVELFLRDPVGEFDAVLHVGEVHGHEGVKNRPLDQEIETVYDPGLDARLHVDIRRRDRTANEVQKLSQNELLMLSHHYLGPP